MDTVLKSVIYQIRHTASGKIYVGSAADFQKRAGQHQRMLRGGRHHSHKLQAAWNKYGAQAFVFEVLEQVKDIKQLVRREQVWIERLDAASKGYNVAITAGSLLGFKHSQETRELISATHRGVAKHPDHVAKVKAALTGRTMTPEQCQKMREAKLGKKQSPHSDETKAKMSAARIGVQPSPETREKMRLAKLGTKASAATRARMSASHKARFASQP